MKFFGKLLFIIALMSVFTACSKSPESASGSNAASVSESVKADWYSISKKTVGWGSNSPKVVILFDPMCPHCAHLKSNLDRAPGPLEVKWVPVAVLSTMSMDYGSRILASSDPAKSFELHEKQVIENTVPKLAEPSDKLALEKATAAIKTNSQIFAKLGLESIPAIITVSASNELIIETGSKSLPDFMNIYTKFEK